MSAGGGGCKDAASGRRRDGRRTMCDSDVDVDADPMPLSFTASTASLTQPVILSRAGLDVCRHPHFLNTHRGPLLVI